MTTDELSTLCTRDDLARYAGIPVKTLSGYLTRKELGVPEPVTYAGRTPLFDRAAARRWGRARKRAAAQRAADAAEAAS